jgi:four helix bundle protein
VSKINSYQDLIVWQKSIDLTTSIYTITTHFPKSEFYGLSSQLQRAAVSIPSNIAEGHARESSKEFLHFISISLGSLAEVETQIIISGKLGWIQESAMNDVLEKTNEIGRMLRGLQKSMKLNASN